MKIPLPKMMRHWREREFERHLRRRPIAPASAAGPGSRAARALPLARRPRSARLLGGSARRRGRFRACRSQALDQGPRHAGARGPQLHGALGRAAACQQMTRARPDPGRIRRSLRRGVLDARSGGRACASGSPRIAALIPARAAVARSCRRESRSSSPWPQEVPTTVARVAGLADARGQRQHLPARCRRDQHGDLYRPAPVRAAAGVQRAGDRRVAARPPRIGRGDAPSLRRLVCCAASPRRRSSAACIGPKISSSTSRAPTRGTSSAWRWSAA